MPKPGEFAWNRLMARDINEAKAFYGSLFGWETIETNIEGEPFYIFKKEKTLIAGLRRLSDVPGATIPHWMSYITVNDIHATIQKAERLGAKLTTRVLTISNLGRVAVLLDPGGAYIGFFEPTTLK
ncbi:glycoxylase (plasmid) [Legionella adelaidensis]|uniref:Glycoxylase n=1 Tax=Legionella adelaidensis TaxID=45056 RepID=A0A0W0R4E4_9GAMM|nr:VOC family protein [Legionella adelaidensis]KTC65898.1 glyoxylase [Legionella adelaidensis]VEH85518.1 glycoxylase [Legionella adelaidensis]